MNIDIIAREALNTFFTALAEAGIPMDVNEETREGALETMISCYPLYLAGLRAGNPELGIEAYDMPHEEDITMWLMSQYSAFFMGVSWERSRLTRAALLGGV